MPKFCSLLVLFFAVVWIAAAAAQEQSLGDVARQQRSDESTRTRHARVVTEEDMPPRPPADAPETDSAGDPEDEPSAPDTSAEAVTAKGEQWKAKIQAQKNTVAAMQSRLDRLNASIHFVEANRYSNGVQYNQHQLRRQQEAHQMQKQLDEQKKKLEDMQESARHEGFGNKVYDP